MDIARVAKAHFLFRWMRIDIYEPRVERQVQHISAVTAAIENIAIGKSHRIHQQTIAHAAAIDEPELLIGLRARCSRKSEPARERHWPG
jgi:hypothetical protein